uniref:NADH-ubiquinone oxidoreductase chain 5 n=1 Tax=Desis jiaxiangi TaxID=2789892 RepID=A0A8B0Z3Q9_9ARAC|nr:NADH dehydrogenase subunit 5 [Desis jiaxiangi]QTX95131.1 NADH dehydrogenase subunit 5 [Desis jiaxiangi]
MSKFSTNMLIFSIIPLIYSIMSMYNNVFISIEIPLINVMSFNIPISIMIDWTSCLFLSTVMFISSMIIMFSIYYIPQKEHNQFSLMLLMFVLSMSILILSDNIIFILVGWDGLGLSSYILVVYYQNASSSASGSITLLSNRLGDIMILISIALLMMNMNWNFHMNKEFNLTILILLLIAASSKSAQFPFSAWLPAAMAAPTPISALVHSSTLVTAGVFLLIRILNNIHPISMLILLISSSATALYASMAANWEQDMKKIIALSTLSQIAMMMFAIAMKSSTLAFLHLIIHALFKSMMFLCAGIMIHNSSYQDMRMMGMSFFKTPLISTILGISTMALMGLPFMSGFFSKDMIIELLTSSKIYSFLSILMIMSIGMTASYSLRMSLFSNIMMFKSKPDSNFHFNLSAYIPIIMMAPFSIFIGTLLIWMMNPQQMFLLPSNLKLSIPMTLFMGMLMGMMLMYKNKSFLSLGESAISLWFNHFMATSTMKMSSPFMSISFKNDSSWQETYGPQGSFSLMKMHSISMDLLSLSPMFLLIIIMLIPLLILM